MVLQLPSKEQLNRMFEYNPETGDLFRRPFVDAMGRYQTRWSKKPIRNVLTNQGGKSYYRTTITHTREEVLLHRIIFKMVYGWEPPEVDHISGNGCDNRLSNLKPCDHTGNHHNRRLSVDNTSGVMGVSLNKYKTKWRARIRHNGKDINLGEFVNIEDAIAVRRDAEIEFGYATQHGSVRPL